MHVKYSPAKKETMNIASTAPVPLIADLVGGRRHPDLYGRAAPVGGDQADRHAQRVMHLLAERSARTANSAQIVASQWAAQKRNKRAQADTHTDTPTEASCAARPSTAAQRLPASSAASHAIARARQARLALADSWARPGAVAEARTQPQRAPRRSSHQPSSPRVSTDTVAVTSSSSCAASGG